MNKIIKITVIFEYDSEKSAMLTLGKCCKAALKSNLDFEIERDGNNNPAIRLQGSTKNMLKYCILTLFAYENKFDGIRIMINIFRFISIFSNRKQREL